MRKKRNLFDELMEGSRLESGPSTPKKFVYSLEDLTQLLGRPTWTCPGGGFIRFTAILPAIGP